MFAARNSGGGVPRGCPDDLPLAVVRRIRRRKWNCVPDCMFKGAGFQGGQRCERMRSWAAGDGIEELRAEFVGPVRPEIWLGRDAAAALIPRAPVERPEDRIRRNLDAGFADVDNVAHAADARENPPFGS